jgi:hypothetical protein
VPAASRGVVPLVGEDDPGRAAEGEIVAALAADQRRGRGADGDRVGSPVAEHDRAPGRAGEDGIVPVGRIVAADHGDVGCREIERVAALVAEQERSVRVAEKRVVAEAEKRGVVAALALDRVVALVAEQELRAVAGGYGVEAVIAKSTDDGVGAA